MARPTTSLINRRGVLEAALRIIDDEGIEALSIRRLGDVLGVNGTSLYHYFQSKDEIVIGAARLALESVAAPPMNGAGWREWLPATVRSYRDALMAHPAIIPIVLRRQESGLANSALEANAARLMDEGVPAAAVLPLIDGLEYLAVGSAMHATATRGTRRKGVTRKDTPAVSAAIKASALTSDEVFDLAVTSMIDAIERESRTKVKAATRTRK